MTLETKRTHVVRNALAAVVAVAAIVAGVVVPLPGAAPTPAPVPTAPPGPPAVFTHVDSANNAVCWVVTSPHGVGISCLSSGPGEFGP